MKTIKVNNNEYDVLELIGHGKGGYSYLVKLDGKVFVAKKIHHEPCSYYQFDNKLESELSDYNRLASIIFDNIPVIIEVDKNQEIIVKEYIDGDTVDKLVLDERMVDSIYMQIEKIAEKVKESGFNLDYFPTNFVVNNGKVYYIDFELNEYSEKWNYQNWGKKYWYRTNDFLYFFHPSSSTLYTDRLILRKLSIEDFEMVFMNNIHIPNQTLFQTFEPYQNKDQVKDYLETICRDYDDVNTMRWAIVFQENQEIIGCIDVSHRDMNDVCHVGYVISEKYIAKGFMSEALNAVMNKAFERGMNLIAIDAKDGDINSNMVAMKNGFELFDTTEEPDDKNDGMFIRVNHYIKRK